MFYNIIGESGSGKTAYLVNKIGEYTKSDCLIIVPEQQALDTEKLLSSLLGDGYNMFCEVLNFERLSNRVFREHGGLSRQYLDGGGRGIIMSNALERLSGELEQYKDISGSADYVHRMLAAITSFRQGGIGVAELETLASSSEVLERDSTLASKLSDLVLIMRTYTELCGGISDSTERVEHMKTLAEKEKFFKGKVIFIDSYYTFTQQEHEIIKLMLEQCDEAFISFCMPQEAIYRNDSHFANISREYRRIKRVQQDLGGKIDDIILGENRRSERKELRYLSTNIWSPYAKPYISENINENTADIGINIYECDGVFAEVSAAAAEIKTLVREKGWKYRDIGIAVRNTDAYSAVIEAVFSKYEIPLFMSIKEEISSKPLLSMVFAAIDCARTDFSPQSVKQYIKSSFSGLTKEESDYLSSYIDIWKIRGKSRYKGIDWQMNPDGYRETISPYAERILAIVAGAKEKICDTLVVFAEEISGGVSAKQCANAIYKLLQDINAEKRLQKMIKQSMEDDDEEGASELSQLWNILVEILDQLHLTAGDEVLTPRRLLEIFHIVVSEYTTGNLPSVTDAVTIADARLARFGQVKALLLLGVNEGVFPSADRGGELFGESEIKVLEKAGFNAFPSQEIKLAEEQFLFYIAISTPSQRLSIYYSSAGGDGGTLKASVAVSRVCNLFPQIQIIRPAVDRSILIQTVNTAADFYGMLSETVKKRLPKTISCGSITEFESFVSSGTLDDIILSPSVVEKYNLCPFSFFARYILKLRQIRTAAFGAGEVGVFLHKLLEEFFRKHHGEYDKIDRNLIGQELRVISEEFINLISNDSAAENKRLSFSVNRLAELTRYFVVNILDEFEQSRFLPIGFEEQLGLKYGKSSIDLGDGEKMIIRGVADRVDTARIGGEDYIRVVDYKSGTQKFTPAESVYGLSLQMFLYLYILCADGKKQPAGVIYMPVKPPEIKKEVSGEKIPRTGLILKDFSVIEAMEKKPKGEFIPVSYNAAKKDGEPVISKNSSVATRNELEHFFMYMKTKLKDVSTCLKAGDVSVNPIKVGDKEACKVCDYLSICRNSRNKKQRDIKIEAKKAREILFGIDEEGE